MNTVVDPNTIDTDAEWLELSQVILQAIKAASYWDKRGNTRLAQMFDNIWMRAKEQQDETD